MLGGDPLHWRAWGELLHSVQTGQCAFNHAFGRSFYDELQRQPNSRKVFDQVMAANGQMELELISAIDFSPYSSIVDLGGGRGDF